MAVAQQPSPRQRDRIGKSDDAGTIVTQLWLEATLADYAQDWGRADAFYETAAGMTTRPASVLNNWGYSKLTRGDHAEAERLFTEAIAYDPSVFTAKNNLVLARASTR